MVVLAFALALALPASTPATPGGDTPEWGGFRGNNGAGLAASKGIPEALDPEANIAWRTELPDGYSSPAVAGEHVFLTGAQGKTLSTICLDRYTGEVRWQQDLEFDGRRPGQNSPAAPSPVTDGEHVYVLFDAVGLIAYSADGDEVWRKELGPFNIPHGLATSPLLFEDRVVVVVDQDQGAFVAAFDKKSGKELWRTPREGVTHGYATPAIYQPESGPAHVVVSGSLQITGYSAESGERLWWIDGAAWQAKSVPVMGDGLCYVNSYMVPSSEFGVKANVSWEEALAEHDADGDGKISKEEWDDQMMQMLWPIFDLADDDVFDEGDYAYMMLSGSATGGLFAVDPGGEGNVTESHVKWKYDDRRGLPDCPSPLFLDGQLYVIKEGGLFTAFDGKTGDVVKQGRVGQPDRYFASPVAAAGRIVTASVSGQVAVISGGPEWEVLSVNDLEEAIWSTPAIADGQVLVRTDKALYCFEDLSGE